MTSEQLCRAIAGKVGEACLRDVGAMKMKRGVPDHDAVRYALLAYTHGIASAARTLAMNGSDMDAITDALLDASKDIAGVVRANLSSGEAAHRIVEELRRPPLLRKRIFS